MAWPKEHAFQKGHKRNQGVNNPRAKLTPELVRKIRMMYATGMFGQKWMACMYGVTDTTINAVVHYDNWKDV